MKAQRTRAGWVLRIDAGEEIVTTLRAFARAKGIRSGLISGLGAAEDIELGYFVRTSREYVTRRFEGEWEIGALTGNLSELEAEPLPHCHAVIGGRDFAAFTGHLFRGVVTATCEVQILTDPDVMRRPSRPDLGFNPLEPEGG